MKSQKSVVRTAGRLSVESREAVRQSQDSIRSLAERYGVNPKTIVKWRGRDSADDLKPGRPGEGNGLLSPAQEALVVACRQHLRLPLDGCLQALRPLIPQLSRSSLHRCLQRYGLSRLPVVAAQDESGGRAEEVCFELSLVESRGRSPQRVLVAIERNSRFAHAELFSAESGSIALEFLRSLVKAVPCAISALIIDEGAPAAQLEVLRDPAFRQVCDEYGIELRTLRPKQRWTREQLERGTRVIERAIASRQPRPRETQLRIELGEWLTSYNSRCSLELLGGRTPAQAIGQKPASRTMNYRDLKRVGQKSAASKPVSRRRHRVPDPGNTREAILQAARKCLAHDGPEGLSLAEVARIAGVNRGTAYQHFETRDKLIEATAAGVSERLFQAVFGAVGATNERRVGAVDIAALTDRLAGFAMSNPELCRAWLLNVLSSPEPASDLFWREYQSSADRFDRTEFSQGGVDTEVLSVIMLAGTFLWPVWVHAQYAGKQDLAVQARRFAEESMRLSMYGNLNPGRYPQLAERLAERRDIRLAQRQLDR